MEIYNQNDLRDFLVFQDKLCTVSKWAVTHAIQPQATRNNRRQSITC